MENLILNIVVITCLFFLISNLWKLFKILFWRPYYVTKYFRKQGIRGPPYTFLYGSLPCIKKLKITARGTVLGVDTHDIAPRVVPHYHMWCSEYGDIFLYWYGTQPRICISDPELAKDVLSKKFGFYSKSIIRPIVETMIGKGLVLVNGLNWVKHRRIVSPAFTLDKLKVMTETMAVCTVAMLDKWKDQTDKDKDKTIEISEEFQKLTAVIISHTAFGSNFEIGKEAFQIQREFQFLCMSSLTDIHIPGSEYLPTQSNIRIWKLHRKLKKTMRSIIESRLNNSQGSKGSNVSCYGDDLLGLLIENSDMDKTKDGMPKLNMDDIIAECKTFFFAGHETTSNLLTWTFYLLSLHNEWQELLRHEVLKECDTEVPNADTLAKLKLVNLVLLEVLRLYCPIIGVFRKASKDMELGNLMIPKGTEISIPIVKIHRMKKYWGEDANEFNPMRFNNGISKAAKHPNALLAFAVGPRACIGQNFAMLEAKMVVVLILQRFSLSLSPEYKHMPADNLTLQPQNGVPVLIQPL